MEESEKPRSLNAVITVKIQRYKGVSPLDTLKPLGKMKVEAQDVNAIEMVEAAIVILNAVVNSENGFELAWNRMHHYANELAQIEKIKRNPNIN